MDQLPPRLLKRVVLQEGNGTEQNATVPHTTCVYKPLLAVNPHRLKQDCPLQYHCMSELSLVGSKASRLRTYKFSVVRQFVVSGDVPTQCPDQDERQDAREEEDDGHTVADGKPVHL